MTSPDPRLHAYRPDLADERLRGQVEAERFAAGKPAMVAGPVADLRSAPAFAAGIDTQLLLGDAVRVFERKKGWAWVQAGRDGYVGYLREEVLGAAAEPTHIVAAPRSFVYPEPELKTPPAAAQSMGARIRVLEETERRGTRYAILSTGGAMIASHLRPVDQPCPDYVSVAELFLHTPYLWGGASGFGIDCSGLVQLSMFMSGRRVLRDTDMQAEGIGLPISAEAGLRRGDLVFWRGHVAIMLDGGHIIHANGHTMTVAREPFLQAVERIERLYGRPTGFRRPD